MPFTETCDVSDDVMPGIVKIGTCDVLSVFPCIRFILNRRLLLKPQKGPQMIILCHMVVKTQYLAQYSEPVQYPHKKAIQSLVATSPNAVKSDKVQSTKTIIPHYVDDAQPFRNPL